MQIFFFQTSDATWQAYNVYGDNNNGKSLYTGVGGKAYKVSYNRPFVTRDGGGGGDSFEDWLFNAEYPMIRWLEANGYDLSYTTNVDSDRRGHLIKNHKVFLSVGHDEYWSATHRKNVTEARDAGIHLAFFSGNEVYWKTRWEKSIDGAETSYRTLVCYKEGIEGENVCTGKCDPTPEWTGLWRSGCEYMTGDTLLDGCRPENELTGQISWDWSQASMEVPADYKNLRFWRNTNVASLEEGEKVTMPFGTIGFEWNPEQEEFRSSYPKGRVILSHTEIEGKIHQASLYRHTSNALVFGAGTVQWSWGLDSNHDRSGSPSNPDMQQATLNLFADMGVQPGSIRPGLIPTTGSTDETPPVTSILLPAEDTIIPVNKVFTISGTAADEHIVAGVEISVDGGSSWIPILGSGTWSYSWKPTIQGEVEIRARSFDDSGNIGVEDTVNVTVGSSGPVQCPCTVFTADEVPVAPLWSDGSPLQLGMKFRSIEDGFITGVRFYKQPGNTGTHTGQLYSRTGNLLAEAVFSHETSSGWQEVAFPSPVAVTAGTTYVISYHSSSGFYSADNPYFSDAVENGPLTALKTGTDGANGVYLYSTNPSFPTQNYQSSNYWVDVVFDTTALVNLPPVVSLTSPAEGSNYEAPATIQLTASASYTDGSIAKVEFFQGDIWLAEDTSSPYTFNWMNIAAGNYSITAKATDDKGGETTSAEVLVSVTPDPISFACPCTVFNAEDTPTGGFYGGAPLQLGMKFRSSVDGYVTGVRFYKETGNTGVHTGQLYSGNGNLLAEAVFASETATGWQEVSFASPVPVTANTTYVISYHSNNGFYSLNSQFFNTRAVVDGPLTGLQSGTDGPNGVYRYSNAPTFPNLTYQSSNYWVDVVFNTLDENALPIITLISPEDNSTFTIPAAVDLEATASDPDGTITKVEFFRDNLKIGEDLSYPYSFVWNNSSTGNYSLTAEATDNSGAKSTSSTVNVILLEPEGNVPPTVSAGEDEILVLPENSITISASANDIDGWIISYLWEQLEGPATEIQDGSSGSLELINLQEGVYVFKVTVTDNEEGTASDEISITVNASNEGFNCPCTVFDNSEIPTGVLQNDGIGGLQLGMKFQSQVDGYITGARFYKQSGNTGVHIGQLYHRNGNLLAEAVFQNETSSGWQQINFDFPVAVTANTTYIISYHTSAGFYSLNKSFYSGAVLNEPLQALMDGSDGGNGVYKYTSTPAFPDFSYNMSNYWVDAVFETTASTTAFKNLHGSLHYSKPVISESDFIGKIEVIPNPSSDYATLVYELQKEGFYSIVLYDARGSMVKILKEETFAVAGEEYTLGIDATSLPLGVYFLRLEHQNEIKAIQLLINK